MMNTVLKKCGSLFFIVLCLSAVPAVFATDVLPSRLMGLDLARDIAQGAINHCRKDGYQVSIVVQTAAAIHSLSCVMYSSVHI